MAAVATSYGTYTAKGIREDLSDMISNISPEDTPVLSMAGRESVSNTLFEWQTDALESPNTANAVVEGDDVTQFPVQNPTVRVGNRTQISRKLIAINGTLEAVDKAGRKSEMAYQTAKKSAELKRDQEAIINQNIGADAGGVTTARLTATLGAWLKTNVDKASDGTNPTYTSGVPSTARTDGTQRAYTETLLKNAVQLAWASGADVGKFVHLLGPVNKVKASAFSGVATKTIQQTAAKAATIIGAADVYVSDFGTFEIRANRFQRERDGWFLDGRFLKICYLRPYKITPLAKTGDAEKRMLLAEWGVKMKNEAAHAAVFDLTTT